VGKISSVEVILQAISRITAIDIRSMLFQDDVLNEQENKPRVSIIFLKQTQTCTYMDCQLRSRTTTTQVV
ncbi:uncharacterized protein METZ01_LOCUS117103, partial [marine metagenome]